VTEKNSKERARLHTANLARIAAVKGTPRETHNMTIKRYEIFTGFQASNYDADIRSDGPWVSYDDHAAFVEKTRALIQVLRMVEGTIEEQDDWTAFIDDQAHTVAELVIDDVRKALAAHPLSKEGRDDG
jgi:hypothetical protein